MKNLNVVVQTVVENNNWLIKENDLTGRKRSSSVHTMSVWIIYDSLGCSESRNNAVFTKLSVYCKSAIQFIKVLYIKMATACWGNLREVVIKVLL